MEASLCSQFFPTCMVKNLSGLIQYNKEKVKEKKKRQTPIPQRKVNFLHGQQQMTCNPVQKLTHDLTCFSSNLLSRRLKVEEKVQKKKTN